jgi:hypothetical protein
MSNVHEEYEDETGESAGKDPVRSHLRKVEQENKLLRQQAAEFETLKREMAFTKAGIDLNVPMAKYFVKGYEGEVSPEAIRQAAEEANLIQPSKPQDVVDKAEQQAWSRLSKAGSAGETNDQAVDWNAKFNATRNQDEVMQLLAQMRQETENI